MNRKRSFSVIAGVILALFNAARARATTYTVNTTDQSSSVSTSTCSLRDAINAANGSPNMQSSCAEGGTGADTIGFSVTGTIKLSSGLPAVSDSQLTINGPRLPGITLDGQNAVRVMQVVPDAALTLNHLTIARGAAGLGGGISNEGKLIVSHCLLAGNSAENGGGIRNTNKGTLTVSDSVFSNNIATEIGGAIDSFGTLSVANSTFSANSAVSLAGAILNEARATVTNSTFVDNSGGLAGGAFENNGAATLTIINSTFSGNRANDAGAIDSKGRLTVTDSTFSGNIALGARGAVLRYFLIAPPGMISLKSVIMARPIHSVNCKGPIVDAGYNISDDASCGFAKTGSAGNGDRVDPMLAPLGNYGGSTQTFALLKGSPAIDAVALADCTDQASPPNRITADQRGFRRPDSKKEMFCDIGAYESQGEVFRPSPPGFGALRGSGFSAR